MARSKPRNQLAEASEPAKATKRKQINAKEPIQAKKQKASPTNPAHEGDAKDADFDTSRPTALFDPSARQRKWTVSIALPGSWLSNAKKPDHKTMQVGRIARAAAVFCVDEIVVYDDNPSSVDRNVVSEHYTRPPKGRKAPLTKQEVLDAISPDDQPWQHPDQFLYHLLSFAECPPHLRYFPDDPEISLFQMHKNLEWAGCLPSMDMPHHLRPTEWCRYREGLVLGPWSEEHSDNNQCVAVFCGLPFPVRVPAIGLERGMRTTLRFSSPCAPSGWPNLSATACAALDVEAALHTVPREEGGFYWGYEVRKVPSLSAVFNECSFEGGYDFAIGTSERGVGVQDILPDSKAKHPITKAPKKFQHLLLVFGGQSGIEPAVANDPKLSSAGLTKSKAHELFDAWVNLVPGQGSRTIRTEEAVEFGLCALKPYIETMYGT